jgi:acetolactate synthase-1/2/3 large subunit
MVDSGHSEPVAKVTDWIAAFLFEQGVTHVYELVGGMITHLIDSLHRRGEIQLVSVRHEQAAAFAADAAGRIMGVPGVAMATSGPGATNLLTGIGSCYFDSAPAVFITGQVNRHEQRGERPIRQLGFQETDIVAMAAPITKAAFAVSEPSEVPAVMQQAFAIATTGRPGPVLVDIPMDVQGSEVTSAVPRPAPRPAPLDVGAEAVSAVVRRLGDAERPLMLVGNGVRAGGATELLRSFVDRMGIPVVNTLLAVDVLPYDHPLRLGLIGSYGNRWANQAVGYSDALLVLGSRLDIRQTGADVDAFKGDRTIVHVDTDAGELNNRVPGCEAVESHLGPFLRHALAVTSGGDVPRREDWLELLAGLRNASPDTDELRDVAGINPNRFMHELSKTSGRAGTFVADVGQHQQWAAQSLELAGHQRFLTSGGMGAMGYGLPAALGAALSEPGRPVVMIAGDGSFQLNIQELQTLVHLDLPVKLVILNNQCHGMVRQFQETYFEARYQSTYWGYSAPAFGRVAEAYGIPAASVERPEELPAALARLWNAPTEPFLLEVMIDPTANAYPKMAFGRPITEMEPLATPIGMEGT